MNLLQAFSVLLNGSVETVGEGYKWKRSVLMFALIGTIASPFFLINLARPYQGATPPDVNVISRSGRVVFDVVHWGAKRIAVASFSADDGSVYKFADAVGLENIRRYERECPNAQLKVSGFFLQDGKGYFWPLSAVSSDGKTFLSPNSQLAALRRARNPFGWKLFVVYLIMMPFWGLSFANARKLMQRN